MLEKDRAIYKEKEEELMTFLTKSKEGEYAEVDQASLAYLRLEIEAEDEDLQEPVYYYSIR